MRWPKENNGSDLFEVLLAFTNSWLGDHLRIPFLFALGKLSDLSVICAMGGWLRLTSAWQQLPDFFARTFWSPIVVNLSWNHSLVFCFPWNVYWTRALPWMSYSFLCSLSSFHDTFRNSAPSTLGSNELASDGIIMDLTYSPERWVGCLLINVVVGFSESQICIYWLLCRNEFAYASSDKLVYIRRFSDRGAEMTLSAVLQGHEAEVTQVSRVRHFLKCLRSLNKQGVITPIEFLVCRLTSWSRFCSVGLFCCFCRFIVVHLYNFTSYYETILSKSCH